MQSRKTTPLLKAIIAVVIGGVFFADVQTPLGIAVWIFYQIPIILTVFGWRPDLPLATAAVCSILIVAGYHMSSPSVYSGAATPNRLMAIATMWCVAAIGRQFVVAKLALDRQDWLKTGETDLIARLQGELQLPELGSRAIAFLAKYLDAQIGAVYLRDDDRFRRIGGFAVSEGDDGFRAGEGVAGQAVAERRILSLSQLPDDHLTVRSALVGFRPRSVVVAPCIVNGEANAVIELGFAGELEETHRALLELVSESLAITFRSALYRERERALLEETQRQSEELQTQQEELRVTNEELEEQSRALKESHASLENQQAELEQSNSQLEEQAAALEQQKSALELVHNALTDKATELERASTYKSEFLANMSHELRTPLNSSLILAKLLADNREGNLTAEQVQFAETIHAAGSDLLTLIQDILDLSKIEAGMTDVRASTVTLSRLIEPLEQTFTPVAKQKHVAFEVKVDASAPPSIDTDAQKLQQILKNLLSNAFKFTERGAVVLTVAGVGDDRVAVSVRDSGIGIATHQHELIFEPFRQVDSGNARQFGGTGLGLSISRNLARLIGGSLTVESVPGSGSMFTLVLPRVLAAPAVPPRLPERAKPRPQTAPAVSVPDDRASLAQGQRALLIVEDDPTFATIVTELGRELGFQTLVASSADEGVALAREHKPTAIILDIGLPDHSGLVVLDQLKRNPATRHIPVHVVSAQDSARTALEMGAVGYMLKPVKRERLAEALRGVESRSQRAMKRVLIVEDDAVQRESVAHLLAGDAIEIVGVGSAAVALASLGSSTFDCMVLDLQLPDASGYDVLERIASEEAYSFPPVIVYTGRDLSQEDEQRLRRYSRSVIVKNARSPERLLEDVTLFLHQVESQLPPERQRILKEVRDRETTFQGRRILVVEDDVRNVFALSRVFEAKGAKIEIARNGNEALLALEKLEKVDLVLMDIMMPVMDGYQAMREIRKRKEWADLPIIALTAKAMPDDQEQCLKAGANDYIAKPLDVDKLLSLSRVWMPR